MSGALLEGMCPSVVEMVIWKTLQGVDGASAVTYGCVCIVCRDELELDGVVKDVFDDASSAQWRGTGRGS